MGQRRLLHRPNRWVVAKEPSDFDGYDAGFSVGRSMILLLDDFVVVDAKEVELMDC
jgi:hypothetical protein